MTAPRTTLPDRSDVTLLGLGAMGTALTARLLSDGRAVTVWNRTPGRATSLATGGAREATSVTEAVAASPVVVVCLQRHASVHEVLDDVVDALRGRVLLNLTTTTPGGARELASWARGHDIAHLDGAILAVPEMIGSPAAQVFYSGSAQVFEEHRDLLDLWGTSTFDGSDPGMASLVDLAMLSAMYQMFAGFLHGAAMAGTGGMSASDFSVRATPFLAAMTDAFQEYAAVVDARDYAAPGQQSVDFSDLSHIVRASEEQGVVATTVGAVQALIEEQVAAGHGSDGFPRIIESLRGAVRTP